MLDSQAIKKDFIFFLKEKLGFTDIEIYTNPNIVIKNQDQILIAVSYTHLTLPTIVGV